MSTIAISEMDGPEVIALKKEYQELCRQEEEMRLTPPLQTAAEMFRISGRKAEIARAIFENEKRRESDAMNAKPTMPVAEFRRLIAQAQNELEIRRIVLWHQEQLVGPWQEKNEALNFALVREMHFAGPADGGRGMFVAEFAK